MAGRFANPVKIAAAKVLLLFAIFFLIACGLGYPVLNRFDPRQTPGLSDVKIYAAMVTGEAGAEAGHVRFRVLVPWVAKTFYRFARERFASWDPVMFGLLMADSLFVAGTAVLIVVLGSRVLGSRQLGNRQLGNPAAGVVGSLLYLVNFAVPNLRLVGLVDAGEGFFLLALVWSLTELELWALPVIAVFGALSKESFFPFSVVLTVAWWFVARVDRGRGRVLPDLAWIVGSWVVGLIAMVGLQWSVSGTFESPLRFGLDLHRGHDYAGHFIQSLYDRNLWYVFLWLLPTAIPNLKRLPKSWLVPVGATSVMAFVLDAYYGGAPGTVGRALFSVAGPMLSLSSALFLLRVAGFGPDFVSDVVPDDGGAKASTTRGM
ncbi:MAG TPA: hypothetical protein VKR59_06240 [Terriglobales bacterium]|nr:hypothetical protein [Terriglobales bacterium]